MNSMVLDDVIKYHTVHSEMLSRYGDTFSKVTPDDGKERATFLKAQAAIVAKVNAPTGTDIMQL